MASIKDLRTTIQLKRDLYSNFIAVDPILKAGEPAVCMPDSTNTEENVQHAFELRIGDGTRKFSELPIVGASGGSAPGIVVDENTIFLTADGKLSMVGFEEATVGMIPSKGENGKLVWIVPTEAPDIKELEDKVNSLDGIVNGKPAGADPEAEPAVPGLVDKVEELENQIKGNPENPDDNSLAAQVKKNTENISNLNTNLTENYYNKQEVDAKLNAAYKPGETLDNVSDLTSPPTTEDLGVIHPIKNPGVTTDDFIEGPDVDVPAGSQIVAIEKDGEIKYTIMPSNVDLTGYLKTEQLGSEFQTGTDSKIEIKEIAQSKVTGLPEALASKLSGVTVDGTSLEVNNGVVALPLALADRYGLVKQTPANTDGKVIDGVILDENGCMKIVNVSLNNLYQSPDDDLIIDGGGASR